ncbi:MAG: universal stress protein [Dehalococcoidales bacterium]|nr:universal stress protein [Dehalococcoidales bacterium]
MEFRKILVPVAGTETDIETINLACRLARRDKSRILAVYIIPIERSFPLDAEMTAEVKNAEGILSSVEKIALGQGYEIETDLLQARNIGPSIIDEALEREADLIVMGIYYKQHFGQYSLGDVTPYVLKNAPCPVILYQQYQPE